MSCWQLNPVSAHDLTLFDHQTTLFQAEGYTDVIIEHSFEVNQCVNLSLTFGIELDILH